MKIQNDHDTLLANHMDVAKDLFNETQVESAYDKQGRFSHLIARVPERDFFRLYSPLATSTIFVRGQWLQLNMKSNIKSILSRSSNFSLTFVVAIDELGTTIISFFKKHQCISMSHIRKMNAEELLGTAAGYHVIARIAARLFERLCANTAFNGLHFRRLPTVQIIPDKEEIRFNSQMVALN